MRAPLNAQLNIHAAVKGKARNPRVNLKPFDEVSAFQASFKD